LGVFFCVFICYRFRGLNQFEEGRIVTKYVFRIVCSVRVCTENINLSALFCFLLLAFALSVFVFVFVFFSLLTFVFVYSLQTALTIVLGWNGVVGLAVGFGIIGIPAEGED